MYEPELTLFMQPLAGQTRMETPFIVFGQNTMKNILSDFEKFVRARILF